MMNTEAGLCIQFFKAVGHLHPNLHKLPKHINPTDMNRDQHINISALVGFNSNSGPSRGVNTGKKRTEGLTCLVIS